MDNVNFIKKASGFMALILVAVSLAACTSAPAQETRTFESEKGTIEIPVKSEKIVTDYFLGDLLAMGITPVGGTNLLLQSPQFAGMVDNVTNVGDYGAVSFEKVAELEPDLIITMSESEYEQYSKIAPTIYITPSNYTNTERMTLLGEVTGWQSAATNVLNAFDARIEEAKTKLQPYIDAGEVVTIFDVFPSDIYVQGNTQGGGGLLYNDLGFKAPERVQKELIDAKVIFAPIAMEVVPEYAGDRIFLLQWQAEDLTNQLKDSSVWKNLDAVKNNKVYEVDSDVFRAFDFISLDKQIDIIVDSFTGTTTGSN